MRTLKDIDHDRDIKITPHVRTAIDDPVIRQLAVENNDSNLLKCDTPLTDLSITLPSEHARPFLEWLASTSWGAVLEEDLQSMAETDKGEPLLSTWLELDRFEALATAAHAARVLPADPAPSLSAWRAQQTRNVYIDGFSLVG